jgi:DNA-binding NarL/FixJ family response regulator/tetratricopeptide (TPR) repeat protein
VLLGGDAGVGKTRVLTELVARVSTAGWRTLVGHCVDFGESALPYLPFSEMFGRLTARHPDEAAALAQRHPALASLQPGRRVLSGSAGATTENLDRGELLDAVHATLESLAESAPLLVVVEDAHWADRSTRDLLTLLFTRSFRGPVVVVTSYRSDDLHRRHPLRATVAEWTRIPAVQRLQLEPLADGDVRRLVRSLHRAPLAERVVQAIVRRAEGNAFFTEELVGAAELGGTGVPEDLADLLLVRLDRLDDPTRDVVRAVSVSGRRVSHALLTRVVDQGESLERALRTAVEQNVLVQVGDDGYAFRHALLAEAVYDDLLPGERVRLHAAYAAALGSGQVEGTAAELARHALAAHDLKTAVRASIAAGDEAMAVGGPDEAARHYETALGLLDRDPPERVDLVGLVTKAADAVVYAGHPDRARKLVADRLDRLPADASGEDRARLLMALAAAALLTEQPDGSLEATTEALGLVPDEPTALRAKLLGVHARAQAEWGHDEAAARAAMEAMTLAQKLDLSVVVADATTTLAGIDERAGDPAAAMRAFEDIVEQARAAGDPYVQTRGLYLLGRLHHERAELEAAQNCFHQAVATARQTGAPWAPYAFDARLLEATTAYQRGQWDRVLAITDIAGEAPPPVAEALLSGVGAAVRVGRGDRSTAQLLDTVRPLWERDGLLAIMSASAGIDLYGDQGDVPRMFAVHDDAVAVVDRIWTEFFQARVRLAALVLGQLANAAGGASAAERLGLLHRVPELLGAVESVAGRVRKRKLPFGPEGVAWLSRVEAEHLRLRWLAGVDVPDEKELVQAWEQTVEAFTVMGHVFETARSQVRLAGVLRATGRTDDARVHGDAARETARRLGAEPLLAELRASGAQPRSSGPAAGSTGPVLTARETEILGLVAQGRSNAEIARQLFISAKTVSVHVSNILAKLDAGGRTEAAAIARRDGLLPG